MKARSGSAVFARQNAAPASFKAKVDTIIVSDIHLGSRVSRAKKLTEIIENEYSARGRYLFNQLILLGDIFDHHYGDHDLGKLTADHWDFLSLIRKISDPRTGIKVVWLKGNHDAVLEEVVTHLFGTQILHDYEWNYGGKRFVATHGDRFDRFIGDHPKTSWFFSKIYLGIQHLDFLKKKTISRFFKRLSKKIYLSRSIGQDMIAYARAKAADVIFCGHTHHAGTQIAHDGIEYHNSGCWTDIPSTYLTVSEAGIRAHEVW